MKEMTPLNIIENNGNLERNGYKKKPIIICSQKNFTTAGKLKKKMVQFRADVGAMSS